MSWSVNMTGRAGALATRVAADFKKVQGAPAGSAEEEAKNKCGDIAALLCAGMADPNSVIQISAQGSAWNDSGRMKSIHTEFKITTVGNFIE